MATDIGVKIGVQGDQQYKQSLKDIIQETKTLNAEMKATESAFDKNASAQDKAKAKMEVLNKQVDKQKEYISRLKDELGKASEEYDENSAKVLKMKENIAKAETALNKMEAEQRDLNETLRKAPWDDLKNKMEQVGEKMKDVGGKMKDVGGAMTKYVTAPILAIGGLAVKSFTEVDDAMDQLAIMTGKTGEELKGLEDIAKNLATEIPVSFEEAAQAVGEVNTRFDLTGEKAEDLSEVFLKFSKLTGTDVVSSIDSTQKAMAAWGMSAEETEGFLDVLLKISQDTGASVETLTTAVANNKTMFDEMGLSIDEAATFLGNLEKNGVDSNTVMAGLKKAFQKAAEEGKPLDQVLADLSETLINGESDTEAYQEAMEIFGNKVGPQLADALRDGRISLEDFESVASEAMGSVGDTFEQTLGPTDKFQTTLNELKILGADVGGTLLDSLTPIIEKVADGIKKVAEWWAGLSPEMQNTILIIGGIVAAIGPVISVIGTLTTVVGALNIALGPVLLIIAAVAAAVAAVILVIKHWGEITEWLGNVWEKVSGWIKGAAENVANWVTNAWNNVKEWTTNAWNNVKDTVKDAAENVKEKVTTAWNTLKENTSAAWSAIKSKVQENGGGIKGILKTATDSYKEMWSQAFSKIDQLTGGKLSEALQKVKDKLAAIKQAFTDKFDAIRDFVKGILDKIKGFFSNLELKLPHIKLPHFKLAGSFSLSPPSIPKISVDWYKSAYSSPVLFRSPTVLATASGLKGFGDGAGGEVVIGEGMMYRMIKEAVRSGGNGGSYDIDITVNGAAGQSADEIAEAVADRLAFEIEKREAAWA